MIIHPSARFLLLALTTPLCVADSGWAQVASEATAEGDLPQWATQAFRTAASLRDCRVYHHLNPFYQRGDFDGDGELDLAIQIVHRLTGKRGIAILHHRDRSAHIIGAGRPIGSGGGDFSWLAQWFVEDRAILHDSLVKGRDVLYLPKGDGAGGIVWWDGRRYVWTRWGD